MNGAPLDPAGPASMLAAVIGSRPRWAQEEHPRPWNNRIAYDYLTSFVGADSLHEIYALTETGWRAQIKAAAGRRVRITLYRVDP